MYSASPWERREVNLTNNIVILTNPLRVSLCGLVIWLYYSTNWVGLPIADFQPCNFRRRIRNQHPPASPLSPNTSFLALNTSQSALAFDFGHHTRLTSKQPRSLNNKFYVQLQTICILQLAFQINITPFRMRCSIVLVAAFVGAVAASPAMAPAPASTVVPVSQLHDGQPQAPTAAPTSTNAALATAIPSTTEEAPVYETVYATEEVTITSCASTVSSCPVRTTMTTYAVTSTPVAYTSTTTVQVVVPPTSTVAPLPKTTTSTTPVAPVSTLTSFSTAAAIPTSTAQISVITISTCVPTTILSTVTVIPSTAAPTKVSSTAAAIPTSKSIGTSAPSGTG